MIYIGLPKADKAGVIRKYCDDHRIEHVVLLSPAKFAFHVEAERFKAVDWPEIIMYRTFYPLLQEIGKDTLVVVNECLRTQNRHDLTYNCIRHYLNQAGHVLVFQWLPCIDDMQDFMVLFDFASGSKWKRERYDPDLIAENARVIAIDRTPSFRRIDAPTDAATRAAYESARSKLFADLGGKDPHTIPRNLYLLGGKARASVLPADASCLARNARLKIERMAQYKEDAYPAPPYAVLEFPHNFIDFADVSCLSEQTAFDVTVADLKVDQWYFERYAQWAQRIKNGYADLRLADQRA